MDGKNDYFYPVHSCDLQDYRLLVFDRWGNVVFDTESVNDKWDGKYMGKISPAGIYTYVVSYSSTTGNLQEQTGSVIIIR
jgi:gliding motility-associated-like protein